MPPAGCNTPSLHPKEWHLTPRGNPGGVAELEQLRLERNGVAGNIARHTSRALPAANKFAVALRPDQLSPHRQKRSRPDVQTSLQAKALRGLAPFASVGATK